MAESTVFALALVVTVAIAVVWLVRTVLGERALGRGQAQAIHRPRVVRLLDLTLFVLGLVWAALLATYFVSSLVSA